MKKNRNLNLVNLICHIFSRLPSAFIVILGRRGTGKTDFGLRIMEIVWKAGIISNFATNVKINDSPFPIQEITNLQDLRYWCKNTHGPKMFLFDEIGKALQRRSPMASLNIKLINEFQIMRKYKLSTVATTIDEQYVDKAVLGSQILDGYFLKNNWKNPKIAIYDDFLEIFRVRLYPINATSIKYDTWDSAVFEEHGASMKPVFKDKDLDNLWDLTHGKTGEDLGLHAQQIARLWRKYVKECLEREHHTSHPQEREDTVSSETVTEAH